MRMVVFTSVAAVLVPVSSVSAALCTNEAFATEYATIAAEINACQSKTGIVLSELDTQSTLYGQAKESGSGRRIPDSTVLQMIALGKLRVKFLTSATPEMVRLGNACVALDSKDRPAMSEVHYALHTALKGMYVVI